MNVSCFVFSTTNGKRLVASSFNTIGTSCCMSCLLMLIVLQIVSFTPTAAFVVTSPPPPSAPFPLLVSSQTTTTTTTATTTTTTVARSAATKNLMRRNMFTGIVEEMGTVVSLDERDDMELWDGSRGRGTELTVQAMVVMEGAYLGCSISVSGVCLTATELDFDRNCFKVGLSPETLRRTYLNMEQIKAGDAVNLERASEIGGRNSGHFVQGHVDGVGTIAKKWTDEDSLFIQIKVDDGDDDANNLMRYIVPKGFIAIDGTSLTVCDVNREENWFTFMLVEYTQKKIIIPKKEVGDKVNIEVDVLGKYSENAMGALLPRIEQLEARVKELEDLLEEKG